VLVRLATLLLSAVLAAACSGPAAGTHTAAPSSVTPSSSTTPAERLGPGGLTLDEEVGAVMMVGFEGPLTDSVKADWKGRQFGGLLVVNLNHNGDSAAAVSSVIGSLRGLSRHRLVAATDQEGGQVCLAVSSLPCAAMPVGQAEMTNMSAGIKALGFDLNLAPVSDVCSGSSSIMRGRCYGTDPGSVAQAVGSAVDGIHAARVLSAAKHFPGHGNTAVSSDTQLPRIDEGPPTIQARDLPPFGAAIAHGTDFVLLGHLFYPALDPQRSADLSPATVNLLRANLGFQGAILSDDMEMGAITSSTPTPEAAVEFLIAGGRHGHGRAPSAGRGRNL